MGRLLALALSNAGWQVTLFDKDTGEMNCSMAAAGLLTPLSELDKAEATIFHLGQESVLSCWPSIIDQLPVPIYYKQSGTIILHHPQDRSEWCHYSGRISKQLVNLSFDHQLLSNDTLVQLEPELHKFENAYYFPAEAHIDSQSLMPALKTHLLAKGVTCFMNTSVISLKPRHIVTKSDTHVFDCVFDCRGLGAREVFDDLRSLRGELLVLQASDVTLHRPIRFLHPRYSLYIVPRPDNVYLVGASEIEADDHSPISVRTTLELLTAAYYVHAGFAEARLIKTVTHCRPTLSNHLPRIQFTEGLVAINGLYRHGYLIAPALASEVVRGFELGMASRSYPSLWREYDPYLCE